MTATAATVNYFAPVVGVSDYGAAEQRAPFRGRVASPAESDAATNQYADIGFEHHFVKLRSLTKDRSLSPENVEMPTPDAQMWGRIMLRTLQFYDFPPTRVVSSAEGGVAICFVRGDKYADVEFLNTGEILGVLSNRRDRPAAWEIEHSARGLTRAAARIREFFDAPPSRSHVTRWPWRRS